MSSSSWSGADCVMPEKFSICCPCRCIPHKQRDFSAVCRVGTNGVTSLGSGPCSWKIKCGAMGFSWWESRKGKNLCKSRVIIEGKAGWSILLHLPPLWSHLHLSSPLCRTMYLLLKEEYFSIPVLRSCLFLSPNPAIFDMQERKEFFHMFLRRNTKWGGEVRKVAYMFSF